MNPREKITKPDTVRSLAIVGPYPPPHGGVTMHVLRLCRLLEEEGVNFIVYNGASRAEEGDRVVSVYHRRMSWLLRFAFWGREPAVCFLSARPSLWLLGWFMATLRGKRVLVRLQNVQMIDRWRRSRWEKALVGLALRSLAAVVCVNRELVAAVVDLGVAPERIHLFPGFLPPIPAEGNRSAVPAGVWEFVAERRPLIVANGKVAWVQGVDLYGLDHLVELAASLKPAYPRVGIVVCCSDYKAEDEAYLAQLMARAEALGVAGAIYFNREPGPFLPVLKGADLFVRPTCTDGDANSIREALYLGIPTVASDAAERPAGVVLYRNRDLGQLIEKTSLLLSRTAQVSERGTPLLERRDLERISAYVGLLVSLAAGTALPERPRDGTLHQPSTSASVSE